MNPDRWTQISKLTKEALSYFGVDRANFLEQSCKGDVELRKEVESLIATYESDPDYLESKLDESEKPSDSEERQIGQYRIVKPIGHGGMGDVFLAVREDTQQHVALKLLRPTLSQANLLNRFRKEQEILAGLNHPNIARLLDIGETEDQLPFLVMEYVDGIPITAYCDRNKLTVNDRLNLFVQVCEAVQYAHQNLVVHRDLKPSNLLVTEEGTVKLLDFGIAKILESADANISMIETQTGIRLLTPAYASPEQVQGQTITTNSDVYSLGVLLYELLTGHRPFDFKEKLQAEVYRIIAEEIPTKPSTIISSDPTTSKSRDLSSERLRKMLSGELDNIVLKTLRKEPMRRYPSALDLASDIDRYLSGLPVLAQPDSLEYRSRKFVGRHKMAVGLGSLLILTLIGFSGLTAWQSKQVANERDRAQAALAKSEQVTLFLQGLFETADPVIAPRDTIMVRDVLDQGATRIESELKEQPELQSAMLNTIGKAFESLGRQERSQELFQKALGISRTLEKDHLEYERSLSNIVGSMSLSNQMDEQIPLLEEYLDVQKRLNGLEHPSVTFNTFRLALLYHQARQQSKSDSLVEIAIDLYERNPKVDSRDLARSLKNLGNLKFGRGDNEEADEYLKESVEMTRRVLGNRHPELAQSIEAYCAFLIKQERYNDALPLINEEIEMLEDFFPGGIKVLAAAYIQRAIILKNLDKLDEAENSVLKGKEMMERVMKRGEAHLIGWSYNELGRIQELQGKHKTAESNYRESIVRFTEVFGPTFVVTFERRQDLAMLLSKQGRFKEAEDLLKPDYENMLENRDADDYYTKNGRNKLVLLYEQWGRTDEAEKYRVN